MTDDRIEITTVIGSWYTPRISGKPVFCAETVSFDGAGIDDIIATCEKIKTEYPEYSNIRLDKTTEYDYGNSDGYDVWRWVGNRMETDEEMQTRLQTVRNQIKSREDTERSEFARLKAKYAND